MSTDVQTSHGSAAHGHGDHAHEDGPAHATLKGYLIGFGLSVVLTAIPFWLVMTGALGDNQLTALAIMALAVVQIVVHMVYFLHMSPKSEGGWTMMALIFTLVMVVIALIGSLWVMYHLNTNMMPSHDMSQMP
jgi:cytochrome o ubiquinol oxidase operon protein cyoD